MGWLRFIPPPLLYAFLFFCGVFFAVLFPFQNNIQSQREFTLAPKQWILDPGKSWFRLDSKHLLKNSSLILVKVDQKNILCRYPVSAIRLFAQPTTISIDVFIPKIHEQLILLLGQGAHKNHQFVTEDKAQNLSLCSQQGPEIAYGKIR